MAERPALHQKRKDFRRTALDFPRDADIQRVNLPERTDFPAFQHSLAAEPDPVPTLYGQIALPEFLLERIQRIRT